MRKFFIVLIILSIQLFWSGCFKDRLIGEFLLTEEMKAQNPFQGGETLYYISDSLKTFIMDDLHRTDHIYKYQPSVNSSDYYLIEVETTSMESLLSNGIYMEMAGQINAVPEFKIEIYNKNRLCRFKFKLPLNKETTDYIDSIRVRDKWYYDVFINTIESDTVLQAKLYYSTEYGVIRMEWPDGNYMELEKIEWSP